MECGKYRGREVVDIAAIKERKRARKEAKERAIGELTGETQEKVKDTDTDKSEAQPLSAEELSKK